MSKKISIALAASAAAVLATLSAAGAFRLASIDADAEPAAIRSSRAVMPLADPARVDQMERLLAKAKAMPDGVYAKLPDETTPTESKLMQVLAYLQNVRPTDGGDGPTGAMKMGRLIQEAATQYRGFLNRRMKAIAPELI